MNDFFATQWTVAHQALPSMRFSKQKYWSGLPFPFPGDLPNPGIDLASRLLHWQADSLLLNHQGDSETELQGASNVTDTNIHQGRITSILLNICRRNLRTQIPSRRWNCQSYLSSCCFSDMCKSISHLMSSHAAEGRRNGQIPWNRWKKF